MGAASVQGIRPENQDRCFSAVSDDGRRAVGAIADGIGGLVDGSGAAGAAIHAVRLFAEWLFQVEVADPELLGRRIDGLYAQANEAIVKNAGAPAKSGTTLVIAVLTETHLIVANVGDSRAWLHCEDRLERLTADHSVVEELVRDGALSPEQAERSPYRNLLTRSLGDAVPQVDVEAPEAGHDAVGRGATIILTSDGVHGVPGLLDADRVRSALDEAETLDATAEIICTAAVDAGSRDNATLVLLRRA